MACFNFYLTYIFILFKNDKGITLLISNIKSTSELHWFGMQVLYIQFLRISEKYSKGVWSLQKGVLLIHLYLCEVPVGERNKKM